MMPNLNNTVELMTGALVIAFLRSSIIWWRFRHGSVRTSGGKPANARARNCPLSPCLGSSWALPAHGPRCRRRTPGPLIRGKVD